LAYSFDLKRRLLIDVIALAFLYTVRILAGGAVIGVAVSQWLLTFSLSIFVSLAFLKRYTELKEHTGDSKVLGRGYYPVDTKIIRSVGPASGLVAVLVLSLYINSADVQPLYTRPQLLWLICPIMLYWIMRMWFMAERGYMHHDPIVHALFEGRSYVLGGICIAVIIAATLL
jgi:4-hydroxybenzoate polyprenyltransferase